MIDAVLFTAPAAPAGAQPAAPEAATPEGFGDVLSAMLAGAAGAAGAQGAKGDTTESRETQAAQIAGVAAELLTALREAAGRMPRGVANRGRQTTEQPTEAGEAEEATDLASTPVEADAPRETEGKVASAAWHASAQALAHVPAWAAPMRSVAPPAETVMAATDDAESAEIGDGPALEVVAAQQTETALEIAVPAQAPEATADASVAPESAPTGAEQRGEAARAEAASGPREQAIATGQDTRGAEASEFGAAQGPAPVVRGPERRVQRAEVRVGASTAVGGGEAAAAPVDLAPQGSAPVPSMGAGVLQRVLDAIELAEHRPPPHTMAVDLPGEGGEEAVRLLVTVRGETVQVSGGPGEQGLPPGWARPLADALAERGMNLDGFGAKERGQGRDDEARPGEHGRAGRPPRRTIPTDDGALRL